MHRPIENSDTMITFSFSEVEIRNLSTNSTNSFVKYPFYIFMYYVTFILSII